MIDTAAISKGMVGIKPPSQMRFGGLLLPILIRNFISETDKAMVKSLSEICNRKRAEHQITLSHSMACQKNTSYLFLCVNETHWHAGR